MSVSSFFCRNLLFLSGFIATPLSTVVCFKILRFPPFCQPARGICAKTAGSVPGSRSLFHNCLYRFSYFSISAVIMDFAFDVSSAQYSPSRRYTGISSSVRFKSTTMIRPSFSNAVTSILSVYLVTPIRCAPGFRKWVKCHMVPAAAVFLNVTADILCPALPVFRL